MHDIRNPWHGCVNVSEGCKNCYMYALDKARGQDGAASAAPPTERFPFNAIAGVTSNTVLANSSGDA